MEEKELYFGQNDKIELFDEETTKELLKTKKSDGTFYTKAEIKEAKKEGEHLLKMMDNYDGRLGEWKKVKFDENGEFDFSNDYKIGETIEQRQTFNDAQRKIAKIDRERAKNLYELEKEFKGQLTFMQLYDLIEPNKIYSNELAATMKKLCINEWEGDVIYRIIYFNRYRLENRPKDNANVMTGIKYFKSLIDNYERFNTFRLCEECVEKMKEEINYWSKAKNESKKIRIKIKATMPVKTLAKYGLEPGNMFESQKALVEYCGVSPAIASKWKKCNYIEEIVERSLSIAEMQVLKEKLDRKTIDFLNN